MIPLKVRPQYRPAIRRQPTTQQQKLISSSQLNDISEPTEPTTRKTTTTTPYIRRRTRPTYIPTTSPPSTYVSPTAAAPNRSNDTLVNKILQRRKFNRPIGVSSSSSPPPVPLSTVIPSSANERRRTSQYNSKHRVNNENGKNLHLSYPRRIVEIRRHVCAMRIVSMGYCQLSKSKFKLCTNLLCENYEAVIRRNNESERNRNTMHLASFRYAEGYSFRTVRASAA